MRFVLGLFIVIQSTLYAAPEASDSLGIQYLRQEYADVLAPGEEVRLGQELIKTLAYLRPYLELLEGMRLSLCGDALEDVTMGVYGSLNVGLVCGFGLGVGIYRKNSGDRSYWSVGIRGFNKRFKESGTDQVSANLGAYASLGLEATGREQYGEVEDARGLVFLAGYDSWAEGQEVGFQLSVGPALTFGSAEMYRAYAPVLSVSVLRTEIRKLNALQRLRGEILRALIECDLDKAEKLAEKFRTKILLFQQALRILSKDGGPSPVALGALDPLASLENLFNPDFLKGWRTPKIIRVVNACLYGLLDIFRPAASY